MLFYFLDLPHLCPDWSVSWEADDVPDRSKPICEIYCNMYLRRGAMALRADPQTAAWRRRTYQRPWRRRTRSRRPESAWREHCWDTIATVRNQEEWGSKAESNPFKPPELIEHFPSAPKVGTATKGLLKSFTLAVTIGLQLMQAEGT